VARKKRRPHADGAVATVLTLLHLVLMLVQHVQAQVGARHATQRARPRQRHLADGALQRAGLGDVARQLPRQALGASGGGSKKIFSSKKQQVRAILI